MISSNNSPVVAGIGRSAIDRTKRSDPFSRLGDALKDALDDAGLEKKNLDGLIVNATYPLFAGGDCDKIAQLFGLDIAYAGQTWAHGRLSQSAVQWAALVVEAKLADYVACTFSYTVAAPERPEIAREGGGAHLEVPWHGAGGPHFGAALSMRHYMDRYKTPREKWGAIPIALRKSAGLNEHAYLRTQITPEEYRVSPAVVDPLRVLDCSIRCNCAYVIILTSKERAVDLRRGLIHVSGMQGMRAGREEFVFGRHGLGVDQQTVTDAIPESPIYSRAGVEREDIDLLYVFDSWAPQIAFALEDFGFCGPGEAVDWVQDGRIELGGELPVNVNGGSLSEGLSGGWGHMVDAVVQLRGDAGLRQVADAQVAQYIGCTGGSVIFSRESQ